MKMPNLFSKIVATLSLSAHLFAAQALAGEPSGQIGQADAARVEALSRSMDRLAYQTQVVWDQQDQHQLAEIQKSFEEEVSELVRQGLGLADIKELMVREIRDPFDRADFERAWDALSESNAAPEEFVALIQDHADSRLQDGAPFFGQGCCHFGGGGGGGNGVGIALGVAAGIGVLVGLVALLASAVEN